MFGDSYFFGSFCRIVLGAAPSGPKAWIGAVCMTACQPELVHPDLGDTSNSNPAELEARKSHGARWVLSGMRESRIIIRKEKPCS